MHTEMLPEVLWLKPSDESLNSRLLLNILTEPGMSPLDVGQQVGSISPTHSKPIPGIIGIDSRPKTAVNGCRQCAQSWSSSGCRSVNICRSLPSEESVTWSPLRSRC